MERTVIVRTELEAILVEQALVMARELEARRLASGFESYTQILTDPQQHHCVIIGEFDYLYRKWVSLVASIHALYTLIVRDTRK